MYINVCENAAHSFSQYLVQFDVVVETVGVTRNTSRSARRLG